MPRLPYKFRGCISPVYTPFNNDSAKSLHLEIIPKYAKFLADRGVTAILVNGTSGEGPLMSVAERKRVAEAWRDAVKITKQHIMIQIGGTCLPDVIELAKHGESIGVDSLLCLPELFVKPNTSEQLVEYLRIVGEAAPRTPLLYYHIPKFTGVNIHMGEFLSSIGERLPSFVGVKFTSTNLDEATQALHADNDKFVVFLGNDQLVAAALALGIDLFTLKSLNVFPELALELREEGVKGNIFSARAKQEKLTKALAVISKYGRTVGTMKAVMTLLTPIDVGPPRPPYTPLSTTTIAEMKKELSTLDYKP